MLERQYEIMFLINVEEYKQTQEEVLELLALHKGRILKQEELGLREFAYPIQKHKKGFYLVVYVEFLPKDLQGFEKELRLKEKVLRHLSLIIRKKHYIRRGKKRVEVIDGQVQSNKTKKEHVGQNTEAEAEVRETCVENDGVS